MATEKNEKSSDKGMAMTPTAEERAQGKGVAKHAPVADTSQPLGYYPPTQAYKSVPTGAPSEWAAVFMAQPKAEDGAEVAWWTFDQDVPLQARLLGGFLIPDGTNKLPRVGYFWREELENGESCYWKTSERSELVCLRDQRPGSYLWVCKTAMEELRPGYSVARFEVLNNASRFQALDRKTNPFPNVRAQLNDLFKQLQKTGVY